MTMRRIDLKPLEPFTGDLINRTGAFNPGALAAATEIIEEVREKGDAALRAYTEKFDGVAVEDFRVPPAAIDAALAEVDPDTIDALNQAAAQIRDFHERQKQQSWFFARQDGAIVGSKVTPLDSVGIYVPGGRALYPSTVLMNALPAQVAGVERIVCVTPPTKDGTLDPTVLAACKIAGVTEIYTVGGAQAVAALAYGTESIRPVAKITGPGNAFVAAAKKLVSGDVGIDMIAGPSEVCVVADETADPAMVAIDLMAQAEHDPLAACYLVTFSDAYADAVEAAIADHMERSTRADITRASLDDHGLIVVCPTMEQALEAVNVIAPEHLEMHVANAMEYLGAIRNAGAIFLGEWTPEAVGDYVAGPNHTLPTGGTARYSSPLAVDDFVKKSSVIQYTASALRNDARAVVQIATHEGLWAHAQSVALRLQSLLSAEQASVAGGSAAAGVDAGENAGRAAGAADE
ncbi:histidinol dehydrogenase [Adlercreutzia mucosicola]|uniref:histidinol dehydrogenase n=1 Tax=Adlercreutzia mucosicola TaxID=580026 RepID=UPI00040ABA08|nr:histidinol dehydrogenase [Adlercreutzia mucosicola]MCR2035859.1 histidinol dehydrogenase [Adlercreutzia mucosicola]